MRTYLWCAQAFGFMPGMLLGIRRVQPVTVRAVSDETMQEGRQHGCQADQDSMADARRDR